MRLTEVGIAWAFFAAVFVAALVFARRARATGEGVSLARRDVVIALVCFLAATGLLLWELRPWL